NCGADPNTVLPSRCDKDFLALLPNGLRSYIEEDRSVTMLMLAAGLGQVDYLRALIDGGANRTRLTIRNKMSAQDSPRKTLALHYCTVTSVPTGISEKNLRAVSSGNRMQPCDAG